MDHALKFNDEAIRQLFSQYVESCQDMERHSEEAVRCAEAFDDFCGQHIGGGALKKIEAYTKMTDVAVEFEEDGFIAGFKVAMNLLLAQEPELPEEAQEPAREQDLPDEVQNTTSEAGESQHEAVNDSNGSSRIDECFITSLQIAELFGTPNWKVVKRIDDRIMPFLDTGSKTLFKKVTGVNCQNKPVVFYKLNQAACMMYLEAIEPKKTQFISIAGGYAKLQELMQKTFHTEAIPLPA